MTAEHQANSYLCDHYYHNRDEDQSYLEDSRLQGFSSSTTMIRLLSVAIVVGLVLDNSRKALGAEERKIALEIPDKQVPILPLLPVKPCYYPTNIRCWTDWFDRDNPSGTGDWETLSSLRKENPGKICSKPSAIEAQTVSGLSVAATGDTILKNDVISGFICQNVDQSKKKMCSDYRVRFVCHPPFCGGGVCWTKWYDRDNPSGTGDWEHLSKLRAENEGEICEKPLYIEAVTTDTLTDALSTGQNFFAYSPTQGLICRNNDQKFGYCLDYKVRFGCAC